MDTKDLNNLLFYIIWTLMFIYYYIFSLLYSLSYLNKWADQSIKRWVKGTISTWSCWNNKYIYLESARRDLQNGVKISVKIYLKIKNQISTSNFLNSKIFSRSGYLKGLLKTVVFATCRCLKMSNDSSAFDMSKCLDILTRDMS